MRDIELFVLGCVSVCPVCEIKVHRQWRSEVRRYEIKDELRSCDI